MEQNSKIRPTLASDVDIIFSYISHLEEKTFDFKSFRERFMDNIEDPDLIYLVAENESGEVTGFVSCHGQRLLHLERMVFEIQEIYVARYYRDRGIGKALMAALEEKLRETDFEILEVTANVKRTDARRFYGKMGFTQTHIKFSKEL